MFQMDCFVVGTPRNDTSCSVVRQTASQTKTSCEKTGSRSAGPDAAATAGDSYAQARGLDENGQHRPGIFGSGRSG